MLIVACRPTVEHEVEKVIERTYKIDPTASLSIRNANGSIVIRGSDESELRLRATTKAINAQRLTEIAGNVTAESDVVSMEAPESSTTS